MGSQALKTPNIHGREEFVLQRIESYLEKVIAESYLVEPLHSAVLHMLFPGGKRIRPLFALSICEDLGGDCEALLPAAAALELLHTSSLIHDDLPSMDDDNVRRGKPTCHVKYGEATAILAGDVLVALSMGELAGISYSTEIRNSMVEELSKTYVKLCNGQQLDILPLEKRGKIEEIHKLKTGALFRSAALFGAMGASVSSKALPFAAELGLAVGVGFQVVDDYLDAQESAKGRPHGSDMRNRRPTFLSDSFHQAGTKILLEIEQRIDQAFNSLMLASGAQQRSETFLLTRSLIERVFIRLGTGDEGRG